MDRLDRLCWLRDRLVAEIELSEGKPQVAALARQLRDTLSEIAALEATVPKGSVVDVLAERRRVRNPSAEGGTSASGGRKK